MFGISIGWLINDNPVSAVCLFGYALLCQFNSLQNVFITTLNKYLWCLTFCLKICGHNVNGLKYMPLLWYFFCIQICFSNIFVTVLLAVNPTLTDLIMECSDSTLLVVLYSSYILTPNNEGRIENDGWSITLFFIQWRAFST